MAKAKKRTQTPLYLPDGRVVWFWKRTDTRSNFIHFSIDGGKHWKSSKERTIKAARETVLVEMGLAEGHSNVRPDTPSLRKYAPVAFNDYVGDRQAAGNPLTTKYIEEAQRYIKNVLTNRDIAGEIVDKPIDRITRADSRKLQTHLLEETMAGRRTSAKRAMEVYRFIMRRAYADDLIPSDPASNLIDIKTGTRDARGVYRRRERDIYSNEELKRLFPEDVWEKADFNPWENAIDYSAFLLATCTGMRRGEILGLEWNALDLDRGIVEIKGALKERIEEGEQPIGPTKGKRPRACPIFDRIVFPEDVERRCIRALRELRDRQAAKTGFQKYVFGYPDNTLRKQTWWTKHMREALKRAGIKRDRGPGKLPLDAHSLRHTGASMCFAAGMSADHVELFFGWSCARMRRNYQHINAELAAWIEQNIETASS